MEQVFDAVVIGAGVNGSASALHLAKTGKRTALIEQFPLPHTRGSSGGHSRIIRYANSGHDSLTPIMINSFQQWMNLEQETGVSLFRPCTLLTISKRSNRVKNDLIYSSLLKAGRKPVSRLGSDVNNEYRTSFPPDSLIMEDPHAGVLMADKCILTIQERFLLLGGTILEEWSVQTISIDAHGFVLLKGKKGIVKAKFLIICAGPWSSQLLESLGIRLPLRTIKVRVFYWRLKEKARKTFSFMNWHEEFGHIYGLPAIEYPGMVKICFHGGEECDPESRDTKDDLKSKEEVCRFVKANFPWIHPEPAIEESCMYTMSPDDEMIIDRHPQHQNIVYACGFSGTGFKTGLAVGQILTEMVTGSTPSFDISAFKSDRFMNTEGKSKL